MQSNLDDWKPEALDELFDEALELVLTSGKDPTLENIIEAVKQLKELHLLSKNDNLQ